MEPVGIRSGRASSANCDLIGPFAVFTQVSLATLAFSSLLYKRHREKPKRPWVIWFFDTSKQAFAAACIHFANVTLSLIRGGNNREVTNPCVWYFLNILVDTTIGVVFLWAYLRLLNNLVTYLRMRDLTSGIYGNPPRIRAFLRQLTLFTLAWAMVKASVVVLLDIFPFLAGLASLLLKPFEYADDTRLEVFVVMFAFPLIMNVLQAWLIDNVIKGKDIKYLNQFNQEPPLLGSRRDSGPGNDQDEFDSFDGVEDGNNGNSLGLTPTTNGRNMSPRMENGQVTLTTPTQRLSNANVLAATSDASFAEKLKSNNIPALTLPPKRPLPGWKGAGIAISGSNNVR
ncbi:hypothetical protein SeMB42_g06355 [Synchytrium endobioticum]|uniref:Uncharacterized protein n=1 Tax=Synchytrium endobioticum TaxID=286115 RepID=A0A507CLM3_9FUNG|nr:hypothetical protein SeMB42_g06355 [Synchytrium endobioticum]